MSWQSTISHLDRAWMGRKSSMTCKDHGNTRRPSPAMSWPEARPTGAIHLHLHILFGASKRKYSTISWRTGLTLTFHPALPSLEQPNRPMGACAPKIMASCAGMLPGISGEHVPDRCSQYQRLLPMCLHRREVPLWTVCRTPSPWRREHLPCYRFVGMPEYVMGHVRIGLHRSSWPLGCPPEVQAFKEYVDRECKSCKHIRYCGGCPYNLPLRPIVRGPRSRSSLRSLRIFDEISERFNKGMDELLWPGEAGPQSEPVSQRGIMSLMQKMIAK